VRILLLKFHLWRLLVAPNSLSKKFLETKIKTNREWHFTKCLLDSWKITWNCNVTSSNIWPHYAEESGQCTNNLPVKKRKAKHVICSQIRIRKWLTWFCPKGVCNWKLKTFWLSNFLSTWNGRTIHETVLVWVLTNVHYRLIIFRRILNFLDLFIKESERIFYMTIL
jgi:hypothetical protein